MKKLFKQFNLIEKFEKDINYDFNKANIILDPNYRDEIIEVKDDVKLTIVEIFDDTTKDLNLKREINVGKNTTLEYVKISNTPIEYSNEFNYKIDLKEGSNVTIHLFEFGRSNSTNYINSDLKYKDINLNINSLVKLTDKAKGFNSFNINHKHPSTFSDIKIKHLLDDNTKAEFEAISVIENNALHSKAFQDCKTILLTDDATIFARPHLEILTDELEASHGATAGGLDKDALYYLQSRGLDEKKANEILIDAFCNTQIENIKNEDLKEWLLTQMKEI